MSQPAGPESTGARGPTLLRALGPGMAMAVVVGNVIGSGIYVKPGGIARDAGDFRVILAAWVLGGFICVMGALCLAELGAMLPSAGGIYVYLREAYGRPVAFLFGWTDFLFSKPGSVAALTVIFVTSVPKLLGADASAGGPGPWLELVEEVAVIGALAWINILGVIWGGRVQGLTTILKVAREIVRQQDGFFRKGVSALKPLVLRDIALATELHESTVSRVTSNKYIATPRGLFELKYFFTASIQSINGAESHSAEAVRDRIREMIEKEESREILSDDRIVLLLTADGVHIARRTVAKYREAMRIPSSVERRRLKCSL